MNVEFSNLGVITAAHGTLRKNKDGSRLVVTTRYDPVTRKNKTRMYIRTAESYKRKSKLSDAEIAARKRFGTTVSAAARIIHEAHLPGSHRKLVNEQCRKIYDRLRQIDDCRIPTSEEVFIETCKEFYPHVLKSPRYPACFAGLKKKS